jgi:hypothetical protein
MLFDTSSTARLCDELARLRNRYDEGAIGLVSTASSRKSKSKSLGATRRAPEDREGRVMGLKTQRGTSCKLPAERRLCHEAEIWAHASPTSAGTSPTAITTGSRATSKNYSCLRVRPSDAAFWKRATAQAASGAVVDDAGLGLDGFSDRKQASTWVSGQISSGFRVTFIRRRTLRYRR